MIYIRGMLFCETRSKRHFRHYMAQIAGNFPLKSAHGTKFPWDGTADPWDGNRNPRDGSAEIPRPAAFPTLKGGRAWVSALTVCHIAHKASRRQKHRLRRGGIPAAHTAAWPTDGGKECRGGADAPSCGRQECRPSYTASRQAPLSWANYPINTGKRSAPRLLRTFGALRCYGILPADVFLCLSAFLSCGLDGGLWRPSCARTRMYIAVPADTCEGMGGARCLGARNRVAWGCLWLRKAEKSIEITSFSITPRLIFLSSRICIHLLPIFA